MINLAVVYYSGTGNVHRLATAAGVVDDIMIAPSNGNPYGVSAVSSMQAIPGHLAQNVTDDNLAAIAFQTRRTIEIAASLKRGRVTS
ncbi:MAG TPA: hypothetical protein VFG35_02260 [Actinoplanes sp.]|nr:hypothetical protein [Actinoplanes sp.]